MTATLSLTGLGQVLEFMYTDRLSLSPENVADVLAVASCLQMQDIITACHTLKSLAAPSSAAGERADASAVEGEVTGQPAAPQRWLLEPPPALGLLTGSQAPRLPRPPVGRW